MADTLPVPDLPGFSDFLGIRIAMIGEDAEQLVALGHHESLRLMAAFNRCAHQFVGDDMCPMYGRQVTVAHLLAEHVRVAWASNDPCGDCPDDDYTCERCQAIADGDWWLTWSDTPAPTRFPLTVLDLRACEAFWTSKRVGADHA